MGYERLPKLATSEGTLTFFNLDVNYTSSMLENFPSSTPFIPGDIYINPIVLSLSDGQSKRYDLVGGYILIKRNYLYMGTYNVSFQVYDSNNNLIISTISDYNLNYNNSSYENVYFGFIVDFGRIKI